MMNWFRKKPKAEKPRAIPPPGCSLAHQRICPQCNCPVESPYALTCPRCRSDLPPLPDCGNCKGCK